ncbi:hypothetical protein AAH994_06035 [Weeksellaceae bacterium A-14]|uniref:hypothetical protein n=1 Tax=Daejeonia sp. YH14 TaxID=3439042 RepID=UPI0031E4D0B5
MANFEEELQHAGILISQQNLSEAKIILNRILSENPNSGRAHSFMGWLYKEEEDHVFAEKHLKLALQLDPGFSPTYLNYAFLLSVHRRFAELESLLQSAEMLADINKTDIAREWAYFYEDTEQYELAIEKYKEYALGLYENELIAKAKEAIIRCKNKLEILNL